MKPILVLVSLICTAVPAAAQSSRVYTNADLTPKPRTAWTRTVTPEELKGLEARQFVYVPDRQGPRVVIVPSTPLFAPFEPTKPLSEPWSMTTYLGHGYGHGRSHVPSGPGIHLVYGR